MSVCVCVLVCVGVCVCVCVCVFVCVCPHECVCVCRRDDGTKKTAEQTTVPKQEMPNGQVICFSSLQATKQVHDTLSVMFKA